MKVQTECINGCGTIFWSPAIKDKMKNVIPLRRICKRCENQLKRATQIEKNKRTIPDYKVRVRSLEGVDPKYLFMKDLLQIERENKVKEIENNRKREQTESNLKHGKV